ncbi:hypothetical protein SZN_31149 [Streptomyces zinciresistens K42]|uniref:Uncharacterized protein n=1 Tax=Streptomyces zinciresistens K42 TaxID=700597 RepID=G2GL34_9ACTN|nr:YcxB family protein [Streptomyces zinciresistens]EGX55777.1 hypothetical protein SZN_31149 [Streptomyces zinciresistens K42]
MDTRGSAAVEFVYRPTVADFEEALRARARRSPAGRVQALMAPGAAVVAVSAVSFARGAPPVVWVISLVLAVAVACWATAHGTQTMARRMFGAVRPYGECRMLAGDRGAVAIGERASYTMDWTVFPRYVETPGLFVLLGGGRAAGVALLPKRGARTPADVDRLRAILDRNLKRL